MPKKIRDLAEVVKDVLTQYKDTRDSDNQLIYCVMRKCGMQNGETFASVIQRIMNGELPAFASITRAKRKVVELYPELDCPKEVRKLRDEERGDYMDFAINTKAIDHR